MTRLKGQHISINLDQRLIGLFKNTVVCCNFKQSKSTVVQRNFGPSKVTFVDHNFGPFEITVGDSNFGPSKIMVGDRNFGMSKITVGDRYVLPFNITVVDCTFRPSKILIIRFLYSIWKKCMNHPKKIQKKKFFFVSKSRGVSRGYRTLFRFEFPACYH